MYLLFNKTLTFSIRNHKFPVNIVGLKAILGNITHQQVNIKTMKKVYLGLGSNLGQRPDNLHEAIERLSQSLSVTRISSIYETAPVGYLDQNDFLNMAVSVETHLAAIDILRFIKKIEKFMGRNHVVKWGPRLIDIDILLVDQETIIMEELQIPHPELTKRRFVLEPLSEIAPGLSIPPERFLVEDYLKDVMDQETTVFASRYHKEIYSVNQL